MAALLAAPFSASAKPTRVPSFGPNGTHWPELIPTPFMYDNTVSNIVHVPCNWTAIKSAIQAVTNAQANSGTLILVAPGTLTGNGSGSGANPVIENVGSTSWGQRVTVAPRDGYGSVKWEKGVRFVKVYGVCFAGFESIGISGVKMHGCRRSAFAWIKCTGHLGIYGTDGFVTEGIEVAELVQPDHYVVSDDSADLYAGGGGYDGWRFDGCYHAPRFFEVPYTGAKPHTDTFQMAAAGGGSYSNITLRDSAYFSSNNCAIQTGNVDGLFLERSYVVSGETSLSRYPHLPGGATEATSNAFNGSGKNFTAKDCVFIGGMGLNTTDAARPWAFVQNTKTNRTYGSSNQPQSGSWTVDTTLNQNNSGMPPYPTDSYLRTIWANPGATTDVQRPVFIPAGGTFNSPQQVTMTCSTAGSTIYYTLDGSTPTASSTRYTGPITVSATTTVRAFATAPSLTASPVEGADYVITNQVNKPVFSPDGGFFSSAQLVTISTSTSGASIRYTLDGSSPTASSTLYSGPVLISTSATLRAIGVKAGATNSAITSANFGIGDSYVSSDAWTNITIPTQTTRFTVRWNAVPDSMAVDAVTGLSFGSVDGYSDLACIARFNINGTIDARNGSSYQALATLNYTAGTIYRFQMDVDPATKKYSVTVTPNGGTPVLIAQNFSFRTEQAAVGSLDHFSLVALEGGSHMVSDIVFGTSTPPSAPQGLRVTSNP
ncbi:chitobiase/beta-hexosaminidase C-terminal domain-containing protein [Luteolibacter flavescens]|uniref:Chitobiase/beta-hexosaminidase C-terminal domain-containing protein n=1 Tax=Luteolibacter flavescens TaxID=1859460 RepID=A0ABT3FRZ4_9BACT|nr:chitobiase/beta-hexosaminidase C-terminal domain-containing protein [Luteolibacter flavescens]MCW1886363.1 chitobiase/beta-hexosaminidase C-terminal domain-containing protein [Luteolibacter flavescens]